jgi:hypothetical protein
MKFIQQAREETAALERAIADSQQRLNDMRAWIAQGEKLFGNGSQAIEPQPADAVEAIEFPQTKASPKPIATGLAVKARKKDQVMSVVEKALMSGARMQTSALVKLVQDAGLHLTGVPVQTLSVYISRDGRFQAARADGGWGLKPPPHKEEPPPDVGPSAGA